MSPTGRHLFSGSAIGRTSVRGLRVTDYRAYTVGDDGHFIGYEPLACADDAEAIEKVKRLLDGQDVELWSGPRFVIRLGRKP
jgi:hypothetical protein